MSFLRFALNHVDPDSGVEDGPFRMAYALKDDDRVDPGRRARLLETLGWFEKNLPTPSRFNRSTSKGYYRRTTRGVAWFRDTADDCLQRMHSLKAVLEDLGHPVTVIRESRIGYVVYEDEFQVIAEPFTDTRTRSFKRR